MRNPRTFAIALALALTVAACGADEATSGPTFDLNATLGVSCGDASFFFTTTDGTEQLVIQVPGLAARATEAGRVSETYGFDDAGVTIAYRTGTGLEGTACTDAVGFPPVVETTLTPVAGSLTITASTDPERMNDPGQLYAVATVTVDSLEFDGIAIEAPVEIGDLAIGWLPG